jgi:two-component system sensor histidine kinase DctS
MEPLASPLPFRATRLRRALPWVALLAMLGVAQSLLVSMTVDFESVRAQDETDGAAAEAAAEVRRRLLGAMQSLQALAWKESAAPGRREEAAGLLQRRPEIKRLEWRSLDLTLVEAVDAPFFPRLFGQLPRRSLELETELSCAAALRAAAPMFSRSYFVPLAEGLGLEVVDLCVPDQRTGREAGFLVGTFSLAQLLEAPLPRADTRRYEFSFVEGDGTRLARSGVARGAGVYLAERVVDVPGAPLQLKADSVRGRPSLIPNLATALVLGLSIALFAMVALLARDVRRRAAAERALAEALAFRKAMEDSLSTGLRARELDGAISYVNPAFCAMVGFTAEELKAPEAALSPPYWPPEFVARYRHSQRRRLAGAGRAPGEGREGYETVFMRRDGERFPVMIYEAPLVDGQGRQTGWMGAVLDLSAQRRVEEVSRQQQDRLQATARLATVGEMASLLSHELNQPLSAIASYASGSLNLLAEPEILADGGGVAMLGQALERIAEQAERAGRVIKSVHDFVRRREQQHETLPAHALLDAVLPLVRMQARKSGVRIDLEPPPAAALAASQAPRVLRVRCDRTMVEQVLINLARNGIQAMEGDTPPDERVLTLQVRQQRAGWVTFSVIDRGSGILPDVAARLFTPFFTTKAEGMGLGLSLCRTVIEQHGGSLDHGPGPLGRGTEFHFTLPAPRVPESGETRAVHHAA